MDLGRMPRAGSRLASPLAGGVRFLAVPDALPRASRRASRPSPASATLLATLGMGHGTRGSCQGRARARARVTRGAQGRGACSRICNAARDPGTPGVDLGRMPRAGSRLASPLAGGARVLAIPDARPRASRRTSRPSPASATLLATLCTGHGTRGSCQGRARARAWVTRGVQGRGACPRICNAARDPGTPGVDLGRMPRAGSRLTSPLAGGARDLAVPDARSHVSRRASRPSPAFATLLATLGTGHGTCGSCQGRAPVTARAGARHRARTRARCVLVLARRTLVMARVGA